MKKIRFTLLKIILLGTLFGCTKEQDYYDPSKQTVSEELQGLNVPKNFDWSTALAVNISVKTDNQYPTKNYLIEIFDNNPIISTDAVLLSKGLAKSNETFTANILVPQTVKTIYVKQTNPKEIQVVKAYTIEGNSITVDFATESSVKASMQVKSIMPKDLPTVVTSYTTPSKAVVISNKSGSSFEMNPEKGLAYVIKDTYTGSITYNGWGKGVELYIEGTWINTGKSLQMSTGDKLIVQNTGTIKLKEDLNISMTESALIFIGKNASFNNSEEEDSKNITINSTNNTQQLVNLGNIKLYTVSQLPLLYNEGTTSIEKLYINDNRSNVVNNKTMYIKNAELTNGYIYNNCQLNIEELLKANGTTFNLASGSLLKAKKMEVDGATFNLSSQAILNVTEEAKFNSNPSKVIGVDSSYGLAKFKKEVSTGWNAVVYSGHVEIECSNHTANQQYFTYYTLDSSSGARMAAEGRSTVTIPSTSCNNGGYTVPIGVSYEPMYPQTVSLGVPYTYAFEDNYPSIGDYDMNDFVADVAVSYILSAQNKISKMTIKTTLRAVGATRHIAAAIQLDGIPSTNISSINRTGPQLKEGFFPLSNGVELGQTYAVIPVVDNAHAALGASSTNTFVNTEVGGTVANPVDITLVVNFSAPIDITGKNIFDMINFFIINGGYNINKRMEVHLKNYSPTNKATDVSSGGHYNTTGNLVYAIRVPASFRYPKEYMSTLKAYTKFESWIKSGGTVDQDWHQHPEADKIYNSN